MAKKGEINRSEKTREYLREHPDQKGVQVVNAMKERGIEISASLVHLLRQELGLTGNGGKKAKATKEKAAKKKAGKKKTAAKKQTAATQAAKAPATGSQSITADELYDAKQLADELGGIDRLRDALDALERLR